MTKINFYVETYGCSANISDSEIISGILTGAGLNLVEKPEFSDLIIINTCIVKQPTENKILDRIKKIKEKFPEKKLIISGCLPEAYPNLLNTTKGMGLISTHRITEILKVVRKLFNNKQINLLGNTKIEKVGLPKIRKNKTTNIVQICSGCLGNCSYCGTKLAKGTLISYSLKKIIKEIKDAKEQGCKEFWLTGQDISCYGFDIDSSLPELLKNIVEEVKGNYFIRLGMLNPSHILKIMDNMLKVCEDEKIFKFFHIPVQSGSDKILKDMNRQYTVDDFKKVVNKIRGKFPEATIGTDLIIGYPNETEKEFNETLKLIEETKPEWTNISKFSSRKNTKAADLKPLKSETVKERVLIADKLANEISKEKSKKWINWSGKILIDNFGSGRNFAYRCIYLNSKEIGKFVEVKINKVNGLKLFGEII